MTVWIGGEGPCMVLLHGVGDQAGAWARMVPTRRGRGRGWCRRCSKTTRW
jgi:hypothetical protein